MDVRELIRREITGRKVSRKFFSKDIESIEREYGTETIKSRLDQLRGRKCAPRELWYCCTERLTPGKKSLVIAPPVFMALLLDDEALAARWLPKAKEDQMAAAVIHPDRRLNNLDPFAYCVSFMDMAGDRIPFMDRELLVPMWERFLEAVQVRGRIPEPDTTWYCSNISPFHFDRLKSEEPELYNRLLRDPHIASLVLERAAPLYHASLTRLLLEEMKEDLKGADYDLETYRKLWIEKKKYDERSGRKRTHPVDLDLLSCHVEKWKECTGKDYVIPPKDRYSRHQVKQWALGICQSKEGGDSARKQDAMDSGLSAECWNQEECLLNAMKSFVDAVRFEGDMSWRGAACVLENLVRWNDAALLEKMIERNYFCEKDMAFLLNLARKQGKSDLLERLTKDRHIKFEMRCAIQ